MITFPTYPQNATHSLPAMHMSAIFVFVSEGNRQKEGRVRVTVCTILSFQFVLLFFGSSSIRCGWVLVFPPLFQYFSMFNINHPPKTGIRGSSDYHLSWQVNSGVKWVIRVWFQTDDMVSRTAVLWPLWRTACVYWLLRWIIRTEKEAATSNNEMLC